MFTLGIGLFPALFGLMCYALRWYSLLWLAMYAVATVVVATTDNTGGCDGGLCLLKFMVLPPVWLGLWLLTLLIRYLTKKTASTASPGLPPAL